MTLYDTHAHFSDGDDVAALYARAAEAGVAHILAVGGSEELNRNALRTPGRVALGWDRDQLDDVPERMRQLPDLLDAHAARAQQVVGDRLPQLARSVVGGLDENALAVAHQRAAELPRDAGPGEVRQDPVAVDVRRLAHPPKRNRRFAHVRLAVGREDTAAFAGAGIPLLAQHRDGAGDGDDAEAAFARQRPLGRQPCARRDRAGDDGRP